MILMTHKTIMIAMADIIIVEVNDDFTGQMLFLFNFFFTQADTQLSSDDSSDGVQLSPEGDVNSNRYTETRSVDLYIYAPTLRRTFVSCFFFYPISWMKLIE